MSSTNSYKKNGQASDQKYNRNQLIPTKSVYFPWSSLNQLDNKHMVSQYVLYTSIIYNCSTQYDNNAFILCFVIYGHIVFQ